MSGLLKITASAAMFACLLTTATFAADNSAGGASSFDVVVTCKINSNLRTVVVADLRSDLMQAGNVTVVCNQGSDARVYIGSDPMTTSAAIIPAEQSRFTNSIDFGATANMRSGENDEGSEDTLFRIDSRGNQSSGTFRGNELDLDVYAQAFSVGNKIPVAGVYRGSICITVDPTGSLPSETPIGGRRCS